MLNNPYVQEDEGQVVIEFASHLVEVFRDSDAYDAQSFIGEVGGTMGLLLGLSLLSIAEMILDKLFALLTRLCSLSSRKAVPVSH